MPLRKGVEPGTDDEPAIGLWFTEPKKPEVTSAAGKKEPPAVAGATLAGTGAGTRALPIILAKDQVTENDSFLQKEMKFARRWLASKGVMALEEDKNPVNAEIEGYFESVRTGGPSRSSGDDTLSLDFQSAHVVQRAPMEVPLESRLAAEQEDPSTLFQGWAA